MASELLSVHACVAPGPATGLRRVTGDSTSITLAWEAPADDGGCPLTGYQLMRDGGGGISDPIATEVDAAAINSRPALTQHLVTLSSAETGKPLRFQLITHNAEASTASAVSQFIIAGLPGKPPALVTYRHLEAPYVN